MRRITTHIYWQTTRKRRPSYLRFRFSQQWMAKPLRIEATSEAEEVAMMEPKFDFPARLGDLIDEARDPVMAIGGALSNEEIIDFLEEAVLTLRMEILKPGGSRRLG